MTTGRRTQVALSALQVALNSEAWSEPEDEDREDDSSMDLSPADYDGSILIEAVDSGIEILDGTHRTAGLIGWARHEGRDAATTMIDVIDVTGCDQDLTGRAADSFASGHETAVQKIIESAR